MAAPAIWQNTSEVPPAICGSGERILPRDPIAAAMRSSPDTSPHIVHQSWVYQSWVYQSWVYQSWVYQSWVYQSLRFILTVQPYADNLRTLFGPCRTIAVVC
jgi:hypothetical protein